MRQWVADRSGWIHAARVTAPPMSSEGLSGATAYWLPFNFSAVPYMPGTQAGAFVAWAWLPFPEASPSAVPVPSSIFQWPTSASAAEAVVNCQVWDQAPLPAAFEALTLQW